jgi:hypothetical protein
VAVLPADQLADCTHKLIDALIDLPGARIGLPEALLGLDLGFGELHVGFGKLCMGFGYHNEYFIQLLLFIRQGFNCRPSAALAFLEPIDACVQFIWREGSRI